MILYYENKKILFHNFTVTNGDDVKIGDKVVKEKNSKVLKIFIILGRFIVYRKSFSCYNITMIQK